jgi:hypothetical protein
LHLLWEVKPQNSSFWQFQRAVYKSPISGRFYSHSTPGMALSGRRETLRGWSPECEFTQLEVQFSFNANPFLCDSPADSESNNSTKSCLDELENDIHEFLQTQISNQRVPVLFDATSPIDSDGSPGHHKEPVLDNEHHFLLNRESARDSDGSQDPFAERAASINLLAMPTPINSQQDAIQRWLCCATQPSPISTPLRSPEPIFDPNSSSFLFSPTHSEMEDSKLIVSDGCEPEVTSISSSEYEADQSGNADYSPRHPPGSCSGESIHVQCHSHDGFFHGDRNCTCNCGSHCDFLRRNSERYECESDSLGHTYNQPHEYTPETTPRDSLDEHFESLDIAERGAVLNEPGSGTSSSTAPERQWPQAHYFNGIVQGLYHLFFRFSSPKSESRFQPEEVDELFVVSCNGEEEDEGYLDFDNTEW